MESRRPSARQWRRSTGAAASHATALPTSSGRTFPKGRSHAPNPAALLPNCPGEDGCAINPLPPPTFFSAVKHDRESATHPPTRLRLHPLICAPTHTDDITVHLKSAKKLYASPPAIRLSSPRASCGPANSKGGVVRTCTDDEGRSEQRRSSAARHTSGKKSTDTGTIHQSFNGGSVTKGKAVDDHRSFARGQHLSTQKYQPTFALFLVQPHLHSPSNGLPSKTVGQHLF
ncbi:hypothetical protein MPH_02387 [Macrophomina phaseolina MS6]|uniref:Uncharacterized protein n=2 Tax=Macrophomina phaseolina TaxID=35725 RepID=K2SU62_MACPH|nr:hypothetical protein MPH_02387 [Macrophomina phaseolina MS6]KAH7041902.1 hypothetical protein B0J12DRAFT_214997 [Macrophomina phaseolina]